MKFEFDKSIIPVHTIHLKDLDCAYDISVVMKSKKIAWYCYQIMWNGVVIKFGMSADRQRTYGERVYRQIAHLSCWGTERNVGSSGAEFRIVEDELRNMYGASISKDQIWIRIWDLSNYPFVTTNPWWEVRDFEQQLISKYKDAVGVLPIGNRNDEHEVIRRPAVLVNQFNSLFG